MSYGPSDDAATPPDPIFGSVLHPVLSPLGFADAQGGITEGTGQVIFCRGLIDSADGECVDLVLDLAFDTEWRIVDVRYWGFDAERWHLPFEPDADLATQLAGLAATLPALLDGDRSP